MANADTQEARRHVLGRTYIQWVALVHDFLLDVRGAERVFAGVVRDLAPSRRLHRGLRRGGHRGPVRRPHVAQLVPAAAATDRPAPSGAAAALSGRDRVASTSPATTSSFRARRRGPTRCWRQCSVHVCYCHNPFRYAWNDRERDAAPGATRDRACLRRVLRPLAPVGLDRRPAHRPLRRQLRGTQARIAALLRPRGRGRLPAGRRRPLLAPGPSASTTSSSRS